jgi:hypothetical protein
MSNPATTTTTAATGTQMRKARIRFSRATCSRRISRLLRFWPADRLLTCCLHRCFMPFASPNSLQIAPAIILMNQNLSINFHTKLRLGSAFRKIKRPQPIIKSAEIHKNVSKFVRSKHERAYTTMNGNLTPSRQVRQTVFATLREAIFKGDFTVGGRPP